MAARKDDVNVERAMDRRKPTPATEGSHGSTVHETEQKNFDASEICGAAAGPTGSQQHTESEMDSGGSRRSGFVTLHSAVSWEWRHRPSA